MTNHAAQLAIIKHVTRQESRTSGTRTTYISEFLVYSGNWIKRQMTTDERETETEREH